MRHARGRLLELVDPLFLAAVAWAKEASVGLRLAMVARAEMIDPPKFGVTVAANRGLVSNIFTTEVEARAWLDSMVLKVKRGHPDGTE